MNGSFRDAHPGAQLAGFGMQLLPGWIFPEGNVKGNTCSSTPLPAAPTAPMGASSLLPPPRMLRSQAGIPTPLAVGRGEGSSQLWTCLPVLCSHSSVWAAHGDTHQQLASGVYPFTVKSVRYGIYMVSAERIRRSSASSCLFETAIIIQAVTLSHRCFWKTIQY